MNGVTRIQAVANVTIDATGTGYCTVTCPSGVRWEVDLTSVSTNVSDPTMADQPLVSLYLGSAPNAAQFLEGSYSGNRDASDSHFRLLEGESLTAQWTGAEPGLIATLRVSGQQIQIRPGM